MSGKREAFLLPALIFLMGLLGAAAALATDSIHDYDLCAPYCPNSLGRLRRFRGGASGCLPGVHQGVSARLRRSCSPGSIAVS